MSSQLKIELDTCLKELHLASIRSCYEEAANKAISESLSYEQYLFELAEQERNDRKQRRVDRWLKESRLPLNKDLASFDLKRLSQKMNHKIKPLLSGSFLSKNENILAFGNPGSGKTHLLSAIGHELINAGYRVYFSSCSMLVQELLAAKAQLALSRYMKKMAKFDVIIIDDLGYVQQSREEMEVLFTLLAERYEKGSVMITSNLPFSKWEQIFKDPMTTAAAIDRLVHHCVILELNVKSYRMEKAKKSMDEI